MKIRTIRAADAVVVKDLLQELGHENDIKSLAWRISAIEGAPRERVMVAELEGQVAALVAANVYRYFHVEGLVCRVTALVVSPGARKKGLGQALIGWVEQWAREQGCDRVEITARHGHVDALAFLLRQGYEDRSRRFFKHLTQAGGEQGEN